VVRDAPDAIGEVAATEPAGRTRADLVVAVMLFALGVASAFVAPERLALVFEVVEAKTLSEVVIPIVFWGAMAACAVYLAAGGRVPLSRAAARVLLAGFVAHALLLLAASVPYVTDRGAYSAGVYWIYARMFCAAVLGAGFAWLGLGIVRRMSTAAYLTLPAALALLVLTYQVVRHDPIAAVAAMAAGGAAVLTRHRWPGIWSGVAAWRPAVTQERAFLVLLFLGAFALRVLFTLRVMTNPNYVETGADGAFYDRIGWGIAQGQGIINPNFPMYILGYARFVALVYWLAGHSYFTLCVVQSLIGAVSPVVIYYIAKPVFGVTVAAFTATLTAVSFPLVFAAAAIGHQALDVTATALLVCALAAAVLRPFQRWWQWASMGALFGAAIAIRETNAAFLLFVYGWLWYCSPHPRTKFPKAAAWLTAGVLLILAPMVARMVNSPEARLALRAHFDRMVSGEQDFTSMPTRQGLAKPLTDPEAAWAQFRSDPVFVLRTQGRAARHFFAVQFFGQPYGEFDLVLLRKGSEFQACMLTYAYLFVVLGLAAGWRRIRTGDRWAPAIALMIGLLVFRTLPHLVTYSSYGHRVPLEPFLILFCQAGFWAVVWKATKAA
jgi:hypothetical protein